VFASTGSGFQVTDSIADRDGVDQLSGVENVRFSDGTTVALADLVSPASFVADDFVMKFDDEMPSVMPLALDDELFGMTPNAMTDLFGADASGQYDLSQSEWIHHAAEAPRDPHDAWSL